MASTGLQLVGFVLGVLSWIGMIVTCASPEWRQNSHAKTMIDKTIRYDGLWAQCRAFITGETHCSVYSKFFIGLPGVLQVCRALMIASITLGFVAIIVTILGIKCTSIGNSNPRAKARAAMIGGLLFLVAGGSVAVVLYYAYHWATNDNYTLTRAFYVAMATSIGNDIASLCLIFGSCSRYSSTEITQKPAQPYVVTNRSPETVSERVQEIGYTYTPQPYQLGSGNPVYTNDFV